VTRYLQTRDTVSISREQLQAFTATLRNIANLTSEEIFQLINCVPRNIVEAYLCLETAIISNQPRLKEEDLDRIVDVVSEYLPRQGKPRIASSSTSKPKGH
jgi:DNA-directed RNA polymerase subunit F